MRFLNTLFYMILIVIGIIISFNIYAYVMGFFVIKREEKGKIVYFFILLIAVGLFLLAFFSEFLKYTFLSKVFLILSALFLLMLAIIVSNNSLIYDNSDSQSYKMIHNNKSHHTQKNGHSFLYNLFAFFGLLYLFHEVFDDDDYDHYDNIDYDDDNYSDDSGEYNDDSNDDG